MNYYGDKISPNMTETTEGYLVCTGNPIGRIGWMDYLGREIPASFGEPPERVIKVYRSPAELFSPATIASFEGKPVTNTHPPRLVDVNSVSPVERGHNQNVRRDGDFLIADQFITDVVLISEIQNGIKRELSSGYDCTWHKIGDGEYEQRDIVGNHVAVVKDGRAGPRVAIQDSKPDMKTEPRTGGKRVKVSQKVLAAMGFKAFVQDAEPEDIARAVDALKGDDEDKETRDAREARDKAAKDKAVRDAEEEDMPAWAKKLLVKDAETKEEKDARDKAVKDAEAAAGGNEQLTKAMEMMDKLLTRIEALEKREEVQKADGPDTAEDVLDAIEVDLDDEDDEDDPDDERTDEEKAADKAARDKTTKDKAAKDKAARDKAARDFSPEPEAPKSDAADAAIRQFIADMRLVIMAIPDEKARFKAAKQFRKSVHDARRGGKFNGYADIMGATAANRLAAMDALRDKKQQTTEERAETAVKNWQEQGKRMEGGSI